MDLEYTLINEVKQSQKEKKAWLPSYVDSSL